jgi:hypothetical protein
VRTCSSMRPEMDISAGSFDNGLPAWQNLATMLATRA